MELRFDLAGVKEFAKLMKESTSRVRKGADIALFIIGNRIRNDAGTHAPYKTGNLRRSLTVQQAPLKVTIGTNLVYARIHDQGGTIKAHTVTPTRAKALRFMSGGRVVFAKRVNIPQRIVKPYKGVGYLTPAFQKHTTKQALESTILPEVFRQFE